MSDRPAGPGWKRAAERVAVAGGAAGLGRWTRRGRLLVLAYHNVVPDQVARTGDPSLHLALSDFSAQLDYLGRHCDVVGMEELGQAAPGRRRPRVILTFDDAYVGALSQALPEVARRGWKATLFVAPGCLGLESLWWDRCAGLPGWETGLRDRLLTDLAGREDAIAAWGAREGGPAPSLSPWHRIATLAELEALEGLPGVTLGAHSWGHPNLAALAAADLDAELARPLEWLRARFERVGSWLAYPYGLFTDRTVAAAARAGYTVGFRVSGGWLARREPDPLRLPRWNVPAGISAAGFALRIAGWLAR
jgi:peptidoglycan/xylan/chitin deacetylase (PgdA/CDA1 family)